MEVVIDNRISIALDDLSPALGEALRKAFTHDNPNRYFMRKIGKGWNEPETYSTWRIEESSMTFPRGGLARVRDVLATFGHRPRMRDLRELGQGPRDIPAHKLTLDPHQVEMVEAAIRKEQGILRCATGGGKTTALLALASRLDVPTLVLVHSSPLVSQWRERAAYELGLDESEIGLASGGRARLRPLTVGIPATVRKLAEHQPEFVSYFGNVMADETHLFAAKSLFSTLDLFPAKYRFGTSAEERRKDRKEFMIYDLLGDVLTSHSYAELVSSGVIVDVDVRVIPTEFRADWYGLPDDDTPGLEIDLHRLYEEMRSNGSRREVAALRIAAEQHAEGRTIVLMTHRVDHVLEIASRLAALGVPSGTMTGEDDRGFEVTKAKLRSGELRCAVGTYQSTGTGIDVQRLDAVFALTPIAGNRNFFGQVRGRACRKVRGDESSKEGATLYYLWDRHVFPRHLDNLKTWNKRVSILEAGEWIDLKRKRRSR